MRNGKDQKFSMLIFTNDAKVVKVPLYEKNEFKIDPDDLRKVVTTYTKMIIINSPHNPTGAVMKTWHCQCGHSFGDSDEG